MKKRTQVVNSLIILLLVFSTAGMVSTSAAAQSAQANSVSVLFILDDSGSMLGNDPANLRYTAAKLFISALDDGDEVAAIRFSTSSQPIIANMTPISNPAKQTELINLLVPVSPDGYTDVKAAFELAETTLKSSTNPGSRKFVIFLTDGQPEVPNKTASYEQEALEIARRLNVPVYAIALTNASQTSFLSQVASQTGGQVLPAHTANDLLDSYLQILGNLKDRTVIGNGSVRSPEQVYLNLAPALMPYVSKVTFIVSKESGVTARLFDPSDQEILPDNPQVSFAITSDPGFAAYSIPSPASGEWRFQVSGSGSAQVRAILHSRLRTKIISPVGMVEAGQPMRIVVNLIEEQADGSTIKIVGEASFSALVTLPDGSRQSLDAFYDDGSHGDQTAGDGNFSREFVETSQPGSYGIAVSGFKGGIPVAASTRVEAIGFPQIVIDQPLDQLYEIRTDPISFSIHLEELAEGSVFEGGFLAKITTPGGQTSQLELVPQGEAYVGEFLPVESGSHLVTIQAVEAYYQGLRFQKEATVSFEDVTIAQVRGLSARLGLDANTNQQRFEVQQAQQGIPLVVTVQSTSPQEQPVNFNLEGLAGFSLQETGSLIVPANGQATFTLHLLGDSQLQPGNYTGELVISGSGAIDLVNNRLPLALELFVPTVTFSVEMKSSCVEGRCWQWSPIQLILTTESTSLRAEQLNIHLDGIDGANLSAESIEVQPGRNQIELEIQPATSFKPGPYSGQVRLDGQRAGVQLLPVEPLLAKFQVDGFFKSCSKPLIIFGISLLVLAIIIAMVIKKIKDKKPSLLVTGTFTYWEIQRSNQTISVDLTLSKSPTINIGNAEPSQVIIRDDSLAATHIMIFTERLDDKIRIKMKMVGGPVKKGYQTFEIGEEVELEQNADYQMGNTRFNYIPDFQI